MNTDAPRQVPRDALAAAFFFGLLILVSHGRSLDYGLFLDDLAHYEQLRAADWSLRGLVDACRLELVGGAVELWWLPETTLRFFRPVAFGLMKVAYLLGGWSPVAGHVASLLWHTVVCWLLWCLLARCTGRDRLSWFVVALFAIHPAHVGTVQWIASQTELIVTAFLLAALLAMDRVRGWSRPPAARRWPWVLVALVCYALALGCRENAILLPGVVLAVDLLHRRATLLRAWPVYLGLGALAAGYLVLRDSYLGGLSLPPRPYVVAPSEPDFIAYVFDKFCYYLLGEFLAVPCVPIGGLPYLRAHPLAFYGAAAGLVLLLAWGGWRRRGQPLFTLGAASLLGFVAPVLPAFESPHHLYLPGIGAILIIGSLLIPRPESGRLRRGVAPLVIGLTLVVFVTLTHFSGLAIEAAGRVEDRVIAEMAAHPERIEDGDTLLVANLPLIAHYARLGVEQATGRRNLRVVALTWSPSLLGVRGGAELEWVDPRTIICRVEPERYFAGPVGRLVAEAHGRGLPDLLAQPWRTADFTVELVEADADGIAALRFRFDQPPGRSGVHLFWGSRTRWAAPIDVLLPPGAEGE